MRPPPQIIGVILPFVKVIFSLCHSTQRQKHKFEPFGQDLIFHFSSFRQTANARPRIMFEGFCVDGN